MLESLYKLPRFLFVTLVLGVGVAFLILTDPPHSLCKTQMDQFRLKQKGILFKDPKSFYKKPLLERLNENCKMSNSPGGCYELFSALRRLLRHFRVVSQDCTPRLSGLRLVKKALLENYQLMILLAWREEVLEDTVSKFNWFSSADMSLFCKIKRHIILFYGKPFYFKFEEGLVTSLPATEKRDSDFVHKRSILSESCTRYL